MSEVAVKSLRETAAAATPPKVILVWTHPTGLTRVSRLGYAHNGGGQRSLHWLIREHLVDATPIDGLAAAKRVARQTKRYALMFVTGWRVHAYRVKSGQRQRPRRVGSPLWSWPPEHPLVQLARVAD